MAVRRQIRICPEGASWTIVVLAILVGAVTRQLNLLMLLGCVLAGPLVVSLMLGRAMLWRAKVARRLPAQLRADQRLAVDVAITNRHRWLSQWGVVVEDTLVREGAAAGERPTNVAVFFPQVAGGETRHASYDGHLGQRGRYRFGPLRISTRFPLGLFRHVVVCDEQQTLIVHPPLGRLTREWASSGLANAADSRRMQRLGTIETDFYGLRDWRSGDSRRRIHWRTSARRGSLVVRQFDERRSEEFALLIDLWQPAEPTDQERVAVERAVSFAATLVAEACRHRGRRITLHIAGCEPLDLAGSTTPAVLADWMDALAVVLPHDRPAFPRSLGHALALVPPAAPTLVLGTRGVDRLVLQRAAGERAISLAERNLQCVDVRGQEFAEYFHV